MSILLPVLLVVGVGVLLYVLAVKKNTETWYPVPFKAGEAYVATATIMGAFDRIEKGERLVYESTGFSRYDGYIGFFFRDSDGKKRRWDIHDDQDPSAEAQKLFEKATS